MATMEIPHISKFTVRNLLNLITGGDDNNLTLRQLEEYRPFIMLAVEGMKACYENQEIARDYPVRVYYARCWKEIEAAGNDEHKLLYAIESLRGSIQWE